MMVGCLGDVFDIELFAAEKVLDYVNAKILLLTFKASRIVCRFALGGF
jgi:hypothetical protein